MAPKIQAFPAGIVAGSEDVSSSPKRAAILRPSSENDMRVLHGGTRVGMAEAILAGRHRHSFAVHHRLVPVTEGVKATTLDAQLFEQGIEFALPHHVRRGEQRVTLDLIAENLESEGLIDDGQLVGKELQELLDFEVICLEEDEFGSSYHISVPLFSYWIRKNIDENIYREAILNGRTAP